MLALEEHPSPGTRFKMARLEVSRATALRRMGALAAATALLCLGVATWTLVGGRNSPGPWTVLRLWLYCCEYGGVEFHQSCHHLGGDIAA